MLDTSTKFKYPSECFKGFLEEEKRNEACIWTRLKVDYSRKVSWQEVKNEYFIICALVIKLGNFLGMYIFHGKALRAGEGLPRAIEHIRFLVLFCFLGEAGAECYTYRSKYIIYLNFPS